MTEEIQEQAPVTEDAGQSAPQTPAETPAETPAWMTALETVPAKELRKNPKIAGMFGSELENARKAWEAEAAQRQQREEAEARRAAIIEKARNNPVDFADEFLSDVEKKEQAAREASEQVAAYNVLGEQIGLALAEIPEWAELDPEERHAEIAKALQGLPPNEKMWGKFIGTATSLIAKRAVAKAREALVEETRVKERAATQAEMHAEYMQTGRLPTLGRATGQSKLDWSRLSDKEFDEIYEKTYLK